MICQVNDITYFDVITFLTFNFLEYNSVLIIGSHRRISIKVTTEFLIIERTVEKQVLYATGRHQSSYAFEITIDDLWLEPMLLVAGLSHRV